jgi:hypothetical protein
VPGQLETRVGEQPLQTGTLGAQPQAQAAFADTEQARHTRGGSVTSRQQLVQDALHFLGHAHWSAGLGILQLLFQCAVPRRVGAGNTVLQPRRCKGNAG